SGGLHIRMDYYPRDVLRFKFSGKTVDSDVTKTKECKSRFISFVALTTKNICHRCFRCPQICGIKFSFLIEHFRMTNGNCRACGPTYFEPNPTHHILTEVDNKRSLRRSENFFGLQFLNSFYGNRFHRYQLFAAVGNEIYLLP